MGDLLILFPHEPFEPSRIEPALAEEFEAARLIGFRWAFYDYEALAKGKIEEAFEMVPEARVPRQFIFRGWMMPGVERGSDIRGLPIIEETRLFFWKGEILVPPDRRSPSALDERVRWENIARRFQSPFMTVDVALLNGRNMESDGSRRWWRLRPAHGACSGKILRRHLEP